jgi:hypothetical protein
MIAAGSARIDADSVDPDTRMRKLLELQDAASEVAKLAVENRLRAEAKLGKILTELQVTADSFGITVDQLIAAAHDISAAHEAAP